MQFFLEKQPFSAPFCTFEYKLISWWIKCIFFLVVMDTISNKNMFFWRPIHLHLIFEKLSWRNQVRQTWFLFYFKIEFCRLQQAEKTQLKLGKNPVHQTGYFKLNNYKNQVQIDRRRSFRPTSVVEIPNRKSRINFYRAILNTLLIWSTKVVKEIKFKF